MQHMYTEAKLQSPWSRDIKSYLGRSPSQQAHIIVLTPCGRRPTIPATWAINALPVEPWSEFTGKWKPLNGQRFLNMAVEELDGHQIVGVIPTWDRKRGRDNKKMVHRWEGQRAVVAMDHTATKTKEGQN